MPEARLDDSGSGLAPAGEGWFVVNVRDTEWVTSETFGSGCVFESRASWFPEFGINISVLEPGKPNCLYHSESGRPWGPQLGASRVRLRSDMPLLQGVSGVSACAWTSSDNDGPLTTSC